MCAMNLCPPLLLLNISKVRRSLKLYKHINNVNTLHQRRDHKAFLLKSRICKALDCDPRLLVHVTSR